MQQRHGQLAPAARLQAGASVSGCSSRILSASSRYCVLGFRVRKKFVHILVMLAFSASDGREETELSVRARHGGDSAGCNHCLVLRIVTDQEPTTPVSGCWFSRRWEYACLPAPVIISRTSPRSDPLLRTHRRRKIPPASDQGGVKFVNYPSVPDDREAPMTTTSRRL